MVFTLAIRCMLFIVYNSLTMFHSTGKKVFLKAKFEQTSNTGVSEIAKLKSGEESFSL